jgi:uncharacterized protein
MPTALITGASSGIGAALARELAADGHEVVLAARRAEPMEKLAAELAVKATVLTADLARAGAAAGLVRELEIRGLAIEVLINNAGLGAAGRLDQIEARRVEEMVEVNVVALTELTRLLLPPMIARRRGRILLVASTAAFQPGPRMAVYYATKAYVLSFGEALAYELRDTGVTVTTLCPGATTTGFAEVAGIGSTPLFKRRQMKPMSSAEVAKIGYAGLKAGKRVVIPGWLNRFGAFGARRLPRSTVLAMVERMNTPQ